MGLGGFFKKVGGAIVDTVEDVGDAVAEVVEDVADVAVDVGKGVWDVHEMVIDYAADAAEAVSPVLGIAGTAVGMPWLGGLDEALRAASDIMDGEMPDLADVFSGATSFIPGLDGLNPSSLLGAGLGELGLGDLGDLGVDALGDALGFDLGSASGLLGGDLGDIVEKLGGEELGSIWDAVEDATDLDLGDLTEGLEGLLGDSMPTSIADIVDQIDDGDIGSLFDALGDEGGVGDFLKALTPEKVAEVVDKAVAGGKAGELLGKLDDAEVSSLLEGVGAGQLGKVVDALGGDELSDMMGKLGSDAVANVIGQATAAGKLDEMFEKLDPATLATTVSTMVTGSAGAAAGAAGAVGAASGAFGLTAAGSTAVASTFWNPAFAQQDEPSGRGGWLGQLADRVREGGFGTVAEQRVDPEIERMRDFIDDLDLTPEQRDAYYERFPDAAPTDAERIEELEQQLEDLQDKLEDVLGEESVEGGPAADADADWSDDLDPSDDLGLDVDLDDDAGGIEAATEEDATDLEADVDDGGGVLGGWDESEPELEPEPVDEPEPEPEPVIDTYDQQMTAADSIESSVDDMFDGG